MADQQPQRNTSNRSLALVLFLLIMAVVAPCWALIWGGTSTGHPLPSAVAPLGMNRVVLVHVLAVLPLGLCLARLLLGKRPAARSGLLERHGTEGTYGTDRLGKRPVRSGLLAASLCAVIGLGAVWLSIALADSLQEWLVHVEPLGKFAVRVVWSLVLVLPWCVAVWSLVPAWRVSPPHAAAGSWLLALAIPIALPWAYTSDLIEKESRRAEILLNDGRLWKGWQIVEQLVSLGSPRPVSGQMPEQLLDQLSVRLRPLVDAVEKPLLPDASDEQRTQLAVQLFSLEQMDRARQILESLDEERPDACFYLAAIHGVQGDLPAGVRVCQRAIELLEQHGEESPEIVNLRQQAYGRLADYLRRSQQYRQAEDVLRSGLDQWKASAAFFHFELGYHYAQGGRPQKALAHYEQAAGLDPKLAPTVQLAIRQLKLKTPVCLLRPSGSPTR
jgi:hypothetical protein